MVKLAEARRQLNAMDARLKEPIAIVGMGCRYPGGVRSPHDLWELVASGRDAISDLPEDRGWDLEGLRTVSRDEPTVSFQGGFIEDACNFDAEFFGISGEEASQMDPQQRLLLETSWEACEDAGIDPQSLRGSDSGVFIGIGAEGYGLWLLGAVRESPEGHYSLGNAVSMTSGRIAHTLKLEGPALTIDTACSSSAVALHVACQSLRNRDCSLAIAGGAAIIATPWLYHEFSRQRSFAIAPDGRCKSFADTANGAGFSEGVGTVLLERLSDAEGNGHQVLAVIRGSASNQDGVSNGLTAPNGLAHEKVIRQALRNAGVSADQIDAVEGHGMGTVLGDPIEAQAFIATYGGSRDLQRPLWLGSLKSNTGHTQSAGAVGGVIKMVMAMRHGLLPKSLHADSPSRHIDWQNSGVSLLAKPVPWLANADRRRAAIHSFGMSGTNVHIIIEEPQPLALSTGHVSQPQNDEAPEVRSLIPWLVSGRGHNGLRRQAQRLVKFVLERPELDIVGVGHTLAVSRPGYTHRAVATGTTRDELVASLTQIADGACEGVVAKAGYKVGFIFTGSPLPPMKNDPLSLMNEPVFASELERVYAAAEGLSEISVAEGSFALSGEPASQAARRVVDLGMSVALGALLREYGVTPSAVVGHGLGEGPAAYIAGALTLSDAARAVIDQGRPVVPATGPSDPVLWLKSMAGHTNFDCENSKQARESASVQSTLIPAALAQRCDAVLYMGDGDPPPPRNCHLNILPAISSEALRRQGIARCLAHLWAAGVAVDWRAFFVRFSTEPARLPTYAFDRRRHWIDHSPLFAADGPIAAARRQAEPPGLVGRPEVNPRVTPR
jgi:acyl transferase domain-containing protein